MENLRVIIAASVAGLGKKGILHSGFRRAFRFPLFQTERIHFLQKRRG